MIHLSTTDEQDTPAVSDEDIYAAPPAVKGSQRLFFTGLFTIDIENAIKYNRPGGTVRCPFKKAGGSDLFDCARQWCRYGRRSHGPYI